MNSQTAVESRATSSPEQVIRNVLEGRINGQISDATADFAGEFRFKDYGIGLEFNDKNRLAEFFQKTREFYPDSAIHIDAVFASGDRVIGEWTFQTTLAEPFFGGLTRKVPVSIQGASLVRTENGKITDWADYYDGLTSRRTALAAHFEEWTEL